MNNILTLFFKGMLIGVAKVMPGISGSLIALNLGLYERGIDAICHFFTDFKKNLLFLSNVGAGIILSIILCSKLLSILFGISYNFTIFFIIGLLLGTVKDLFQKNSLKNFKQIVIFIISFIFLIILFFLKNENLYQYNDSFFDNLYVVIIGFLDALTMIVPGVSGTAVFLIMGCYEFFLSIFADISVDSIKIIFFFIVGLFLGIIIVSYIVNYLLNNKRDLFIPIILGFSLSSIFFLVINNIKEVENIYFIPILIIGYKVSIIFNGK